ncbi:MAG: phenylalanine--tRNA ligase subunit beta [Nanoarchaeota archaeon]
MAEIMPTLTLNRRTVEKLMAKKLPLEQLKDRISYLGTDLESVSDDEIVVEVFPNRPDMLSEQGFARALASFVGQAKGLLPYHAKPGKGEVHIDASVSSVRPFTACAIVRNLSLNDERIREIIQMQEKLHVTYGRNRAKAAIGIYPLEKIALPIRYMAKLPKDITFRPLEAAAEMTAIDIIEQHPTGKAYGHLLEGKKLYPLFIDAKDNVLSMPPLINSHLTGRVTEETKDVFIECSGFDYVILHKLICIIVTALVDMGGAAESMKLVYPDKTLTCPDFAPMKMKLDQGYANSILGLKLGEKEISGHLERMGYGFEDGAALVPCYRADVLHPIDLVEDIAIAYGFEHFEGELPNIATVGKEDPLVKFCNTIARLLIGQGLIEVNTFHLASKNELLWSKQKEQMALSNALAQEYNTPRPSLLPSLLSVLAKNKHHDYPQHLFDIGAVFLEKGEEPRLGMAFCGHDADFTLAKRHLEAMLRSLGIPSEIHALAQPGFIPGRVGVIKEGNDPLGHIGEVHPEVLSAFGIEMPVSYAELDVKELLRIVSF